MRIDRSHVDINPTNLPLEAAVTQLIADANDELARLQHEYAGTEQLALALAAHGFARSLAGA